MTSSKFDTINKILSQYTIESVGDAPNNDLICILCNKLLVDPCQTSCGCQYCYQCIRSYLTNEELFCPGGKADCKDQHLNFERDVFRNIRLATRISKLIVKCPNEMCPSAMELSLIDEHLKTCIKPNSYCPFSIVGCIDENVSKHNILEHLNKGTLIHTQLMISLINNIKNEFDGLKEASEVMKSEINLIREALSHKENQTMQERREFECFKENVIALMDQDNRDLRNEIEGVISFLKKEIKSREAQNEEQKREIDLFRSHIDQMEWEKTHRRISELNKEVNDTKIEIEKCNEDRERQINNLIRLNKLRPNIDMDFMWRIEDYSKKRRTVTDVYSDSFYSNNYKFCLNLYIYGDNLGLWCVIMKGNKDDCLEWPMKRTVTLSILDQETLVGKRSSTFQFDTYQKNKRAFDRPKHERNEYCIGTDSIIQYSLIKESPTILVNDSIVVSCTIR